jgi:hypothetical protein
LMVCALTDRQKTVANIPTPITSFVMASPFCFVKVWRREYTVAARLRYRAYEAPLV